jgi:hypothetical protein
MGALEKIECHLFCVQERSITLEEPFIDHAVAHGQPPVQTDAERPEMGCIEGTPHVKAS